MHKNRQHLQTETAELDASTCRCAIVYHSCEKLYMVRTILFFIALGYMVCAIHFRYKWNMSQLSIKDFTLWELLFIFAGAIVTNMIGCPQSGPF